MIINNPMIIIQLMINIISGALRYFRMTSIFIPETGWEPWIELWENFDAMDLVDGMDGWQSVVGKPNINLVGGLVAIFGIFSYIWVSNHPNWLTHIFQRGGPTTNQIHYLQFNQRYRTIPRVWCSLIYYLGVSLRMVGSCKDLYHRNSQARFLPRFWEIPAW